jgi:multidrug efflux system outer membrane protein
MKISQFFLLLVLMGCTSVKNIEKPEIKLPETWQSQSLAIDITKPQHWWQSCEDKTLHELIEVAIENNNNIQIAKERVVQARAHALGSTSKLIPSVNSVGKISRGNPGIVSQNKKQTIYQASFDASYEVDLFGVNTYSARADKFGVISAEENLNNYLLTLVGEVASQYVNLRYYQENLKILKKLEELRQRLLNLDHQSHNLAGIKTVLDENKSYADLMIINAQITDTESQIFSSYNAILTLLGKNPGEFKALLDYGQNMHLLKFSPSLEAPSAIIAERPDVKQAENNFYQKACIAKAARRAIFPNISISSMFGSQDSNLSKRSSVWQFNSSALMPLFNWGLLEAQIKSTKSEQNQALYTYKQTVIEALADVETKLHNNFKLHAKALSYLAIIKSKDSSLQIIRMKHKAGLASEYELLLSQLDLYSSKLTSLTTEKDYIQSQIALCKALGMN